MAKEKACRNCRTIYETAKCPTCSEGDGLDSFKGKVIMINPEQSEIAKELKLTKKGIFAIRLR